MEVASDPWAPRLSLSESSVRLSSPLAPGTCSPNCMCVHVPISLRTFAHMTPVPQGPQPFLGEFWTLLCSLHIFQGNWAQCLIG